MLSLLLGVSTVVKLDCEDLFSCRHDSMKRGEQFPPSSNYHQTPRRYWQKVSRIGQTILSCGESDEGWLLPNLMALCEVENDSCLVDLTKWLSLCRAQYEYVMTHSPGGQGIDVALLYSPFSFQLLQFCFTYTHPMKETHPTCDILYAKGRASLRDTLHVFVVHTPSRTTGEHPMYACRRLIINRLLQLVGSLRVLSVHPHVLLMDDFNDYSKDESIRQLIEHGLVGISQQTVGTRGARGTYHCHGDQGSSDYIMVDGYTAQKLVECHTHDAPFLLKEDEKYGGMQLRRSYLGPRYQSGFSGYLSLVARLQWDD